MSLTLCRLLALALFCESAFAQSAPGVTRDIPYTADATGNYGADLYTPPGSGPFPAIVMIHGGSWRSGHKSELRRLSADLAAHGYLCFSIDYDTHPRSFPYSWQESRAAVAFLRAHAAQYHADPGRIAVLGTSAGGQLAALLAVAPEGPAPITSATADASPGPASTSSTTAPAPQAPPAPAPVPVAAAVLFNGGYDLHPEAYLLRRYLGGRCATIPKVCNDASPDEHIRAGAPPIFVGHGTHDHLIPYSQATGFVSRLQAAGDPVTAYAATDAGHSYWRSHKWYAPNLAATEAFLAASMPPR